MRRYRITVRGRLSQRFAATFDTLTVEPGPQVTALVGDFRDQAQLYGVLEKIADYGLELAGVEEQPRPQTPQDRRGRTPTRPERTEHHE